MKGCQSDRSLQLTLPRLPFDNSPLTPRKRTNCSYINNHKAYLKTKGFSIEDVYSLNRTRNAARSKPDNGQSDHNMALINPIGSNIELPPINADAHNGKWRRKRGLTQQKEDVDVWKPHESRRYHNQRYYSMVDLERERVIPGHLKPDSSNTTTLGRVLSRERLVQLLEEEKQNIPSAFYTDYFLTPRSDVRSSISVHSQFK